MTLPSSPSPFRPAVRVGNLLFVSGQASTDDTTLTGCLARLPFEIDCVAVVPEDSR